MQADASERCVVVTGAAGGIGAACCRWFAGRGWTVVGVDLNEPASAVGVRHHISGSVDDGDTWEQVRGFLAVSGLELRALVNNAALQLEKPLLQTTVAEFTDVLNVNVLGVFRGLRFADRAMAPGGSIVNMGSILGVTADPMLGAYSVSKGAVLQLTRNAALAFAPRDIAVNAVLPGAVRTPLTTRVWDLAEDPTEAQHQMEVLYPLGRITEPDEVAEVVGFLAERRSRAMTGSLVTIDGGITATNAEFALTRELPGAYA